MHLGDLLQASLPDVVPYPSAAGDHAKKYYILRTKECSFVSDNILTFFLSSFSFSSAFSSRSLLAICNFNSAFSKALRTSASFDFTFLLVLLHDGSRSESFTVPRLRDYSLLPQS